MNLVKNFFISTTVFFTLILVSPANAWPHRKAHVSASFATLSGVPDSGVSVRFTASNGKTIVAHADHGGHIAVSLSPGIYSVTCSRGDRTEWQAEVELRPGANDLIDAITVGTFVDLTSHKSGGVR